MLEKEISNLASIRDRLPEEERRRFDRLFQVSVDVAQLMVPPEMEPWVIESFGSKEAVESQTIVTVRNHFTGEGAVYSGLRKKRPQPTVNPQSHASGFGTCDFCRLRECTAEDTFGRVKGPAGLVTTAANITRFAKYHSLLVFDVHDPQDLTRDHFIDAFATFQEWLTRVVREEPIWPMLGFNFGYPAGQSIRHPHMQAIGTASPTAKVETLISAATRYESENGESYFDAVFHTHEEVGLSVELLGGSTAIACLAAAKERDILIRLERLTPNAAGDVFAVIDAMRRTGTESYNLAIHLPAVGEPNKSDVHATSAFARFVARPPAVARNSDFAWMELFAHSVISSDPYETIAALAGSI